MNLLKKFIVKNKMSRLAQFGKMFINTEAFTIKTATLHKYSVNNKFYVNLVLLDKETNKQTYVEYCDLSAKNENDAVVELSNIIKYI